MLFTVWGSPPETPLPSTEAPLPSTETPWTENPWTETPCTDSPFPLESSKWHCYRGWLGRGPSGGGGSGQGPGWSLRVVSKILCVVSSALTVEFHPGADPGFGQGGPQLLRPKVADVAKWSRVSEASILQLGSRARLRALEAFGFLMLKYAFSHILETLFLLFLTSILTPKVDKNRALDFTSINLRHSDMLHLFFNL